MWGRPLTKRATAILALFAALLAGCGKQTDESNRGDAATEVTVTRVVRAPLATSIVVNGNLAGPPNRDAKLAALVPGRLSRVLVNDGDAVRAGQLLAEIENPPLRDQWRQAQAAVAQAQANLQNARLSAQREEGLLQRGIASRKEVEDARTQLAVSEAGLQQAEAAFSAARAQVARTEIQAPFAGTVVHRFAGVGDQVDGTAAQPIFEVADINDLELLGSASAASLNRIPPGKKFSIEVPDMPGMEVQAAVIAVAPAVDPASNVGTVRIRIANPKHLLKHGQYLSVAIPLEGVKSTLLVPKQALYPDENGELRVYRVKGDVAEAVAVKVGAQTQEHAEVLEGLNEGDTVVVEGGYGLPEQAKVRIKR